MRLLELELPQLICSRSFGLLYMCCTECSFRIRALRHRLAGVVGLLVNGEPGERLAATIAHTHTVRACRYNKICFIYTRHCRESGASLMGCFVALLLLAVVPRVRDLAAV